MQRITNLWAYSTLHIQSVTTYEMIKRAIDIAVAGIALLVALPFLLLVAAALKLDSPGPVLFGQTRVGKDGSHFTCWKFRSMVVDAEAIKNMLSDSNEISDGPTFKIRQDPRITRLGKWIRKFSVDELPQLWNVVSGDMTLVGPRPPIPSEVAEYSSYEMQRLAVVPGITCLWQISGRSELPFTDQVRLDLEYIDNRSVLTDLLILIRTVPAVLSARGAY